MQKIKHLDEQNDELFDDRQAALSSKGTDWAYEREWRINCAIGVHPISTDKSARLI
ncbi:hypothetical protein DBL06_25905 [Agrobacterium pusense]|nr:hypothetical protein DBL06_25905 [Agrobacterium pusense]